MSPSLTLLALSGTLYAAGIFLLLERSLTRVLLGILLLGNATNLLLLSSGGRAGGPPIVGVTPADEMSDPLPHAMILTAIVITLGMAAFFLTLIHRGWDLAREDDDVVDDAEDRLIARSRRHHLDDADESYDHDGRERPDQLDGDDSDGLPRADAELRA